MAVLNSKEEANNEVRIPTALDSRGIEITIWEAKRFQRYYRCVECGEFLIPRKGPIRSWYFAHYPQENATEYCFLRTVAGVKRLTEDLRVSQIEIKERKRIVRLAILPNFDTGKASLVAVFRAPDWEEFQSEKGIEGILDTIKISGDGILKAPDPHIFHPNNPDSRILLDPSSGSFKISIESDPALPSICGNWEENGLKVGTIFAGDLSLAEKIENRSKISEEDIIYQIVRNEEIHNHGKVLSIGEMKLSYFNADQLITHSEQGDPLSMLSLNPFDVDVLLPASADPHGYLPIFGNSEGEALIAIRPKENLDPEFEIVSVPSTKNDPYLVKRTGPGEVRYQTISFPKLGSKRISIHLGRSHVFLHLFVKKENLLINDKFIEREKVGIQCNYSDGNNFRVYPWQNDIITVDKNKVPEFKVFRPTNVVLNIDIEAFAGDKRISFPHVVPEQGIDQVIDTIIREGATIIILSFSGYGSLKIHCFSIPEKLNDNEIERRILERKIDITRKITWATLREITGISSGTLHHSIRNITNMKQIRRVVSRMRNDSK